MCVYVQPYSLTTPRIRLRSEFDTLMDILKATTGFEKSKKKKILYDSFADLVTSVKDVEFNIRSRAAPSSRQVLQAAGGVNELDRCPSLDFPSSYSSSFPISPSFSFSS